MAQTNLIFAPFGILPSLIWLLYYLREDVRPEPKKMILKIFVFGALVAFPIALFEIFVLKIIGKLNLSYVLTKFLENFLAIAFLEEFGKYLIIKVAVLKSKELDEPIDLMIYMIVSGLGFAAVENVFLAFSKESYLTILIGRFLSATLLHALCSGILGYFLALAFFEQKKKFLFLSSGFLLATGLHGLYDFSIIEIEGNLKIFIVFLILISAAIFLKFFFQRSKKIKSICKI
jgi:RsiW-degrading membrane proteinase PrsW (M82 family)